MQEDILKVWSKALIQNYELAEECLNINYYGAKSTAEALISLLQLSDSPRIVNVSSTMGTLKVQKLTKLARNKKLAEVVHDNCYLSFQFIPNEWAKGLLSNADELSEERIHEVLSTFLRDFKEDSLETKGWPTFLSAYTVSKAALNAHTRILAKNYPNFSINCVCPGYVKTDMTCNRGMFSIEEGAAYPVRLALLPHGGPSGLFLLLDQPHPF